MAVPKQFGHVKGKLGFKSSWTNVYASTAASAAITNTTDEAIFDDSVTLPAGMLKPGTRIRITAQGIATSTNGTDALTLVLRIGGVAGTALISLAATDVADDDSWLFQCELVIRTVGATGTFVGNGFHTLVPGAAGTPETRHAIIASTAINTTVAQEIGVTADWSAASASNSCRSDFLSIEIAE